MVLLKRAKIDIAPNATVMAMLIMVSDRGDHAERRR
jgi:hypothetical protein